MIRTNSSREHTNREYELELRRLREQLLLMGAKVEEIINGSIRALPGLQGLISIHEEGMHPAIRQSVIPFARRTSLCCVLPTSHIPHPTP